MIHAPAHGRAIAAAAVVALVSSLFAVASAPASAQGTRGFDGSTVTVAALGIKSKLGGNEAGVAARVKRFNDTNEIKGVKIDFTEFADDNQDPATALSEARRLVTQTGVFAIVGDVSANNPVDYFTQQQVPYFGGGFDATYCSTNASTKLWGFSVAGCSVPTDPSFVNDSKRAMYRYVAKKTGKKNPTMAVTANDNESGKNAMNINLVAMTGAGFKVTYAKADRPDTVSDFTPYTQAILKGANGSQPDAVDCLGSTDCLGLYSSLTAAGYTGSYFSGLYSDALVKPLSGSLVNSVTVNVNESTPGVNQMKQDLDAYQPGLSSKIDLATEYGYTSTDMFIQALKTVAKKGTSNITPQNVQKAASTMTWKINGLMGPVSYPKSTVMDFPACNGNSMSNGTSFVTTEPYTCSTKTFSPMLKTG
jgi:ABC-type branched-subunit amino acid transport system substrate-binding protein